MQLAPDLTIREINPRLEQLLGYSNREVVGQEAEKILVGNDQTPAALAASPKRRNRCLPWEICRCSDEMASFSRRWCGSSRSFNEKSVEGILIFIQDQSEKEQIRQHTEDLENRASLGMLMSVFAHEVRNPINNISIALQVMAIQSACGRSATGADSRMLQDCDRLEELIKSVLGYSKPMEYEMEPLDLGPSGEAAGGVAATPT